MIESIQGMAKKLTSSVNGREFYVDPVRTEPIDGTPCFSEDEIRGMKGKVYTKEELDKIFDKKLEEHAPSPREDIGYVKPTPKEEIAHKYGARIKELLANAKFRT